MTKEIEIAEMIQRVTETEAKLNAAGQEGRRHVVRLFGLLDVVEKDLTHKQQQIGRLEEENSRAVEQIQQLTKLLHLQEALVRAVSAPSSASWFILDAH